MKKLNPLFAILFVLLTAFTCENEPLEGEFVFDNETNANLTCTETTIALASALENFNNANDTNYDELCQAYSTALQNQINDCGDSNGNYESILSTLGDCSNMNSQLEIPCSIQPNFFFITDLEPSVLYLEFDVNTTAIFGTSTAYVRALSNSIQYTQFVDGYVIIDVHFDREPNLITTGVYPTNTFDGATVSFQYILGDSFHSTYGQEENIFVELLSSNQMEITICDLELTGSLDPGISTNTEEQITILNANFIVDLE